MERGTPSLPLAPAGAADVAKMRDGETVVEGAAGAKNENIRGTGNSVHITTSTAMTSPSARTGSSTSYLHSSRSRNSSSSSARDGKGWCGMPQQLPHGTRRGGRQLHHQRGDGSGGGGEGEVMERW